MTTSQKLLIANRGEIAVRIMRTARRMGLATVAVYSDADRHALHVARADEAYRIGPPPARESYLRIEAVLEAARESGADAIHPGYGFLSENASFAEAVGAAGLTWIGPPPAAIRAMGSKAESKALMERAGVPLVPGYHGADQTETTLANAAERIGYPVLIKASAGGGGKGMRVVEREADFRAALDGARREAAASFGDDRVLVEKYLLAPRHIEIQVFADARGNTVSFHERDCSIQRRHQKIVEEAPAPGMTAERRAAMGAAACDAARAVGYVGAGTVEFIAQGEAFFFMEMNTRLQVEHPVTEKITGLDLVEQQIRVARGEPKPWGETVPGPHGHAIEVRIYAEDPARDFLPSVGRLTHLREPRRSRAVRIDTGVRAGDAISPFYDPMIAKLIVHGGTRAEAVRQLAAALGEYEVAGVETNLGLLRRIAADEEFAAGRFDTGFIAKRNLLDLMPEQNIAGPETVALAALATLAPARGLPAGASPWDEPDGFRINGEGYGDVLLRVAGRNEPVSVRVFPRGGAAARLSFEGHDFDADWDGNIFLLDSVRRRAHVTRDGTSLSVVLNGRTQLVTVIDPLAASASEGGAGERVAAPIPARVVRILLREGDTVAEGEPVLVLEAMKMELTLRAPYAGRVSAVRCTEGSMVAEGAELLSIARA